MSGHIFFQEHAGRGFDDGTYHRLPAARNQPERLTPDTINNLPISTRQLNVPCAEGGNLRRDRIISLRPPRSTPLTACAWTTGRLA
jgi:hypothetical protein